MPKVTFIAHDGSQSTVEVKPGESIMFGATQGGVGQQKRRQVNDLGQADVGGHRVAEHGRRVAADQSIHPGVAEDRNDIAAHALAWEEKLSRERQGELRLGVSA